MKVLLLFLFLFVFPLSELSSAQTPEPILPKRPCRRSQLRQPSSRIRTFKTSKLRQCCKFCVLCRDWMSFSRGPVVTRHLYSFAAPSRIMFWF